MTHQVTNQRNAALRGQETLVWSVLPNHNPEVLRGGLTARDVRRAISHRLDLRTVRNTLTRMERRGELKKTVSKSVQRSVHGAYMDHLVENLDRKESRYSRHTGSNQE